MNLHYRPHAMKSSLYGGHYVERYNGKEVAHFTYEFLFFAQCPSPCGRYEDMSCILVKGEYNATCHTSLSKPTAKR